ncbi:SLC13 family permease [Candidatus Fermentibacteria bacterium]|nr:SLC13 family permease [Candidatus Fermentibacteria bacterium]
MTAEQTIVTCVLGAVVVLLYSRWLSASVIFVMAAAFLTAVGVLTPSDAMTGFSNDAIAVLMMLLLVSQTIRKTGILEWIFETKIKLSHRYRNFMGQMMPFVAGTSAFMNNTPIVALLVPFVGDWGRRHNVAASRLMIPVSFAAIFGGMTTLIGTSTNLIVNSLVVGAELPGLDRLAVLDFTPVGVMLLVGGMLYMLLVGHRLLPSRKEPSSSFEESPRKYLVETLVEPGSSLVGRTIEEAKLRSLEGLYLAEIIRDDETVGPIGPDEVLEAGDVLLLVGATEAVAELVKNSRGLALAELFQPPDHEKLNVIEVVVSPRSSLTERQVREADFRGRYDAAILAVHRQGERLLGKIGDITLRSGDLLLLVAGADFEKRLNSTEDLYVISKIREIHNIEVAKSIFIVGSSLACILLSVLGLVPLFKSLLVLLVVFMVTRIATLSELRHNFDFNLLIVAAFALAVGRAVDKTGLGGLFSDWVVEVFEPLGVLGVLAAVYLVTNLLADFITTAAAAAIVFPFAGAAAVSMGADPKPFVLAVAYGAAANFITPIGYQTNLLIYGPGGYRFSDFTKVGLPLKLLCTVIAVLGLGLVYGLV